MLKIDILADEDLQLVVNRFISALLPHENFVPDMYSQVLHTIFKYIHLDEFQMEYKILLSVLNDLNKIKVQFGDNYVPKLEIEQFQLIVEMNVLNAIVDPTLGVKEWLEYEGLNSNLNIETVKEEACQRLCERAMDLYEICYELAVSSADVLNEEPSLRAAFMSHCSNASVNTQRSIILQETRVGRRKYHGFDDWLKYSSQMLTEIKNRLNDVDDGAVITLDSIEKSSDLLRDLKEFYIPIADYGIPEIDDFTPILRHRMVVVVGKENIGKTKFAVNTAVNIIMAGGKVVYMCGETHKAKVYADIIINYVWKMYDFIIRDKHIADPSTCPEEIQILISMAISTIINEGRLILADAFNYDTVYDELLTLYDKEHFDACIIDHSCALVGTTGSGSLSDKVGALSVAVRNFRKAFPVYMMVTSHPSTLAKNSDSRGSITTDSPTKGSQDLSADADEVFYIRDDETYRKQNKVILENTKRRNAGRVNDYVVLTKKFEVSAFVYDPADQKIDVQDELKANKQDALLDELYSSGAQEDGGYVD